MTLNEGHRAQFLTAAHLLAVLHEEAFGGDDALALCQQDPKVAALIERIGEDLGALYQAIGNAKPWQREDA